ncbi:essential imv membrane protein [Pteropox virus]|uniref:Essential imv membrane protein n=1 Tax=Pteropox virus TaxID=1873698 RepID=A0A1B1MRK5_9POXV|nr:essential imv membrane protein [Pteropox virus]ANS71192.1 essential imv membrane protein [Pteropox virus]
MDLIQTIRTYYSGALFGGIALLVLTAIFAFLDFSKTTPSNYTWRALSITCFVVACIILVGLFLFVGYGRYCTGPVLINAGNMRNVSDIELNCN